MKALFARTIATLVTLGSVQASQAFAMPTWYLLSPTGNERDVNWKRLSSDRFSLYFDEKSEPFARHALSSFEFAYPYLSQLLGVTLPSEKQLSKDDKRTIVSNFDYIPIVLSTRGDYGGFANFGTQNIELQVASGSSASLFQHELVHRLMYEHFDPSIGPAGRAFSLAMLPTWWIEGLAEYLTESVGRIDTAGVSRTMALNDAYLSWDRMHALYGQGDFFLRGYVTSGRLVKYIIEKTKTSDLNELLKTWFWKTVTPPFVNAPDSFYSQMFDGKSGREMYEDFKSAEKQYWQSRYENMPALPKTKTYFSGLGVGYPAPVIFTKKNVVLSSMQTEPYYGGLYIDDIETGKWGIRKLSTDGSSRFDLLPYKDGNDGFWTAQNQKMRNAARGAQIIYTTYDGALENFTKKTIQSEIKMTLSTSKDPYTVDSIYARPNKKAWILAVKRGVQFLFEADANAKKIKFVHSWPAPLTVRFVKVAAELREKENDQSCVDFVINADFEKTYLERFCPDDKSFKQLETGSQALYIKDATRLNDQSLIALVGWNEALGLARIRDQKTEFLGPLVEYADNLQPTPLANGIALWVYNGDSYTLRHVDLEDFAKQSQSWRKNLADASIWKNDPVHAAYKPPFVEYSKLLSKSQPVITVKTEADIATDADNKSEAAKTLPVSEATYRSKHFYSYPTVLPPPLAPWTFGLTSIPLQDEMERYRILLNVVYNSDTKAVGGAVSYQSSRLFDGFLASVYSQERYNGQYYVNQCVVDNKPKNCVSLDYDKDASSKGVNYLREQGVELQTSHEFLPTSLGLNLRLSGSKIEPSSDTYFNKQPPAFLGATRTYLLEAGASIYFNLFQFAYLMNYSEKQNTTDTVALGHYVLWSMGGALGVDTSRSVLETKDGLNNDATALKFTRVSASGQTSVGYREKLLTLRSNISGTLGKQAFNLRELYQPYRTYLAGAGSSLNAVNMLITGDANIFNRATGYWSYRNSADISFPIVSDFDQKFYIAYFEALRGEIVIARGGVARDNEFKDLYNVTSASAGARIDIDIKGVKIFPRISFGKIINEPGWSLFGELAFSQIL